MESKNTSNEFTVKYFELEDSTADPQNAGQDQSKLVYAQIEA